jgi:hybrid cluster-associated redox disulfide protein
MDMSLPVSPKTAVKTLLDTYPHLIETFVDLKLKCPGCAIEAFHTIADVSRENRLDLDQLLERIHKDISKKLKEKGC